MTQAGIAILLFIVCGLLSARLAQWRGRRVQPWIWLGIVFGPLAWIALALLPSHREA